MLVGSEAEEVMLHVILRCDRRKKGLTVPEIKTWARDQVCVRARARCLADSIH